MVTIPKRYVWLKMINYYYFSQNNEVGNVIFKAAFVKGLCYYIVYNMISNKSYFQTLIINVAVKR